MPIADKRRSLLAGATCLGCNADFLESERMAIGSRRPWMHPGPFCPAAQSIDTSSSSNIIQGTASLPFPPDPPCLYLASKWHAAVPALWSLQCHRNRISHSDWARLANAHAATNSLEQLFWDFQWRFWNIYDRPRGTIWLYGPPPSQLCSDAVPWLYPPAPEFMPEHAMPNQVLVFEHLVEHNFSCELKYHFGSRCEIERWTARSCFDSSNSWSSSPQAAAACTKILKDRALWCLEVNQL